MSKPKKSALAVPVIIIIVGLGWLLNAMTVIPDINWVWTLGLAAVGLLTLVLDGLNRVSVVVGPFFLAAACFSVLRQTGTMTENIEVPCLVIVFGVLLLISYLVKLPAPTWILEDPRKS